MNQNTKRLVLLNLPYVLMGLYATNLGYAWRLAVGADFSEKMMSLMSVLPGALGRILPSFHPLDLVIGLCCGVGLRLAVYLKGKNAKKYRHGSEYGSARCLAMRLQMLGTDSATGKWKKANVTCRQRGALVYTVRNGDCLRAPNKT